jgi:hypothetical protein
MKLRLKFSDSQRYYKLLLYYVSTRDIVTDFVKSTINVCVLKMKNKQTNENNQRSLIH